MWETMRASENTAVSKNSLDALAVHPQVQTRYTQNIANIAKQWNERFVTETSMQLAGKSYGKNENGKRVPDLNSDFWTTRSNEIIEQQSMSMMNQWVTQKQIDDMMNIVNIGIRWRWDLTGFGRYIRIESLLLAQWMYYSSKNPNR